MTAMKTMKAMKVMKKRSSGVHRDHAVFKKLLQRTEKKFWHESKCLNELAWWGWKRIITREYEQTIFVLKQRLATEVLAEFDFIFIGQLFPRAPSDNQSLDICILRQRPELYSGRFGSGGRAPRWKNELYVYTILGYIYIWLLAASGKVEGTEGTKEGNTVDRDICGPEPMSLSLRI